jgi:lactate permease
VLRAEAAREHGLTGGEVLLAWMPFIVLVVVVAAWTDPWSSLPAVGWYSAQVQALAPETNTTISAAFKFAPWVGGTAILASWLIVAVLLGLAGKLKASDIGAIFAKTFHQMWGALLVGVFIFGLAFVFNYSGMASSLAKGFSYLGTWFIVVAPILGFIGVALSGSNTSTNAMFGKFQSLVGVQLGFPPWARRRLKIASRSAGSDTSSASGRQWRYRSWPGPGPCSTTWS